MNRSSSARRRAEQTLRTRAKSTPSENTAILRLVICGVIFVFLTAAKLLFPDTVNSLAHSAGELIGKNADFKEAFAAVGRAISGEEPVSDSLQDAYTAVFNPQPPENAQDGENAENEDAAENPAEDSAVPQASEPEKQAVFSAFDPDAVTETVVGDPVPEEPSGTEDAGTEEAETEESGSTAAEALSYVSAMPAMPENASLEQRNLGFAYSSPILGTLTSTFGWREHPIEGGSKFHYGVDLAAPEGSDICAFADGTVYAAGESSSLGNYVMLQHENGYITLYAHCSKVTAGSGSVAMGDKIAEVGSTGLATGPHLHFELHDGELYLNPIFYVEVG